MAKLLGSWSILIVEEICNPVLGGPAGTTGPEDSNWFKVRSSVSFQLFCPRALGTVHYFLPGFSSDASANSFHRGHGAGGTWENSERIVSRAARYRKSIRPAGASFFSLFPVELSHLRGGARSKGREEEEDRSKVTGCRVTADGGRLGE